MKPISAYPKMAQLPAWTVAGMAFLAIGTFAAGYLIGRDPQGISGQLGGAEARAEPAESGEREILYWVAPMDPNYRRDEPGLSPMGMELVPVYADEPMPAPGSQQPMAAESGEHEILYWVAPMDPNYRRDEPGLSPMGMELVPVYADEPMPAPGSQQPMAAESGEREILYWVAPMDPNYRRDEPGLSPMGMELVPVYADAAQGEPGMSGAVRISPAVINNMGVRTAAVRRGNIARQVRTVGYVGFDETRMSSVNLRTDGWVERLHVKAEGERVRRGQLLFEVYSPTLANAQEEYLQALEFGRSNLIDATRKRLQSLGISAGRIRQLEERGAAGVRVPYYAQQAGVVAKLNVREGAHVQPGTSIMTLADLSTVWVVADVFEQQAGWVAMGQSAEVRVQYLPNQVWRGTVNHVYPSVDRESRTLQVRLRLDNPDEALKPAMFAQVVIDSDPRSQALSVPAEALIRTGTSRRIIKALGDGRFVPVAVETGTESGDRVEILSGLREGEEVVVSAQFLIDSEASIRASFTRMAGAGAQPAGSQQAKSQDGQAAAGLVRAE